MSELFEAGLILTLVGMSVVFALLGLLVAVVHAVSGLGRTFAAESGQPPAPRTAQAEEEIVGVVSAAIQMHRSGKPPPSA